MSPHRPEQHIRCLLDPEGRNIKMGTTRTEPKIQHRPGCPGRRIETTVHPHITVTRCVDCGVQDHPDPLFSGPLVRTTPRDTDLMKAAPDA
jgi:hypothetical protein